MAFLSLTMNNLKNFLDEEDRTLQVEQQAKYLFFTFPIISIIFIYFSYLYNFVYNLPHVNYVMIPIGIVFFLSLFLSQAEFLMQSLSIRPF